MGAWKGATLTASKWGPTFFTSIMPPTQNVCTLIRRTVNELYYTVKQACRLTLRWLSSGPTITTRLLKWFRAHEPRNGGEAEQGKQILPQNLSKALSLALRGGETKHVHGSKPPQVCNMLSSNGKLIYIIGGKQDMTNLQREA